MTFNVANTDPQFMGGLATRKDVRLRFENAKGKAEMLISEASPPVGDAIIKSDVGYHTRRGRHSIEPSDWRRFLELAEYHLKT